MRRVACRATLSLNWSVFESEWTLLVGVALHASGISSGSQAGLFCFEATVGIVAISATHRSFKNLMVKRLVELMLDFTMTSETKLRVTHLQQLNG